MTTLSLLKYEALGNDFLIALDPHVLDGSLAPAVAAALCDRHRGVGADGVIVVRPPSRGGAGVMELYNADGGRAETSGNGLRCLALALVDSGTVATRQVVIETDGGAVTAAVGPRPEFGGADVTVSMGTVTLGPAKRPAPMLGERFEACAAEVGNPHLVLVGPSLEGVDISIVGPELERARPGGQNVEVVAPDGEGGLELVVWERGAGATEACGSGSCAAAAAARAAGLVGDRVPVANPGGRLVVDLAGPASAPSATLTGPARRVARLEVEVGPEGLR